MLDYYAPLLQPPGAVMVGTWSPNALGIQLTAAVLTVATANWIAANVAVFVPFSVIEPTLVTKVWWANGSAVAGNIDVGIFSTAGNVLTSAGSTAQAGINAVQAVDVADVTLARGDYYLGMVSDTSGITQKVSAASPAAGISQSLGLLEQAAVTLPFSTGANPATFAKYTRAFVPLVGFQGYRTVGP